MTRKLPEWSISKSLHLLADLYDRDPAAPHNLLSQELDAFGFLDDDLRRVPAMEQLSLLRQASQEARAKILRKTLIDTLGNSSRHSVIEEHLDKSRGLPLPYDREQAERVGPFGKYEAMDAAEQGMTLAEYRAMRVKEQLTEEKIESEILRYFADRIEEIASAIERFDDTAFDRLIPEGLSAPFRELHINAVLGNYGTACILCGAVLERTLQDLLPSKGMLNDVIAQAKKEGLLVGHNCRFADRIRDDRNNAVHGKVSFSSITSDDAWELVNMTRTLVSNLYKGRLD